jgi:polyisoprenoid-binding protein YceI
MKTLIKTTVVLFFLATGITSIWAANYKVDLGESHVKWNAKKVVGQHNGIINFKQGSLDAKGNVISAGNFEIDMQTIVDKDLDNESWNSKLITHLKSDDFFSVEKFPVSSLVITKVEKADNSNFHFTGNLTIKGITNPVQFDAMVLTSKGSLIAEGTMKIDRTLYKIEYGSGKFFSNLGNNMIDDAFTLDFKLVAKEGSSTSSK